MTIRHVEGNPFGIPGNTAIVEPTHTGGYFRGPEIVAQNGQTGGYFRGPEIVARNEQTGGPFREPKGNIDPSDNPWRPEF